MIVVEKNVDKPLHGVVVAIRGSVFGIHFDDESSAIYTILNAE